VTTGWRILAAVLLAAAAVAGFQWYISGVRSAAVAAGYARRDSEQKVADNKAMAEALADVARLNKVLQGVSENEKRERERAAAAAVDARAAGERLRTAEARLRSLGQLACPGAAAAAGGPSTNSTSGVLADMQRRLDEAQERTAEFADASRRAGLACERIHDALK
jgi:hypothetical protein